MKWLLFVATLACVGLVVYLLGVDVAAQPEVLPESAATEFADGSECFVLRPIGLTPGEWIFTSPNGSSMSAFATSSSIETFVCVDGSASPALAVTGDLIGAPVNGTWTVDVVVGAAGVGPFCYQTRFIWGANEVFDVGIGPGVIRNVHNMHLGPSPDLYNCISEPAPRAANDPQNARYYRPDGPSGDRAPIAFTSNSTVTSFDQMNVTGSYAFNATGDDTHVWFKYADGNHTGQQDLTLLPNGQQTSKVNKGDNFTGNHNASIPYNNNAGTSYQFCANNSLGESCGQVLFQPAGQGDDFAPGGPPLSGQDEVISDFRLTVSHAQCDGDAVAFVVYLNDEIGPMDEMNVTIYDTRDGSIELLVDYTKMIEFGETIWLFNRTMASGTYAAVAYLDRGGPLTQDRIWSVAFNVPRGSCDVDELLDEHAATLAAIASLNLNINGSRIEAILANLTAHRDGSLEVNNVEFGTLDFGQYSVLLLYLLVLGIALWHGWLFVAVAPTLAFPGLWIDPYPVNFTAFVFLSILAVWVQYLSNGGFWSRLSTRR